MVKNTLGNQIWFGFFVTLGLSYGVIIYISVPLSTACIRSWIREMQLNFYPIPTFYPSNPVLLPSIHNFTITHYYHSRVHTEKVQKGISRCLNKQNCFGFVNYHRKRNATFKMIPQCIFVLVFLCSYPVPCYRIMH